MKLSVLLVFLWGTSQICAFIEPVLTGIGAVGVAIGKAIWYFSRNTCYSHSVDKAWNVARNLSSTLSDRIFGQHFVKKLVVHSVRSHLMATNPQKALVLSFHGPLGTGKTYVAKLIANAIYPNEGMLSPNVHLIFSPLHFPIDSQRATYKVQLQEWIKSNITACPRSIFIFDDIDKMPSTVIDGLKPFIDFQDTMDGFNFRQAIFIFLSNTGGKQITDLVHELRSNGTQRGDISYEDLESLITLGAFNEDGGLKASKIIQQNLVDHYIPFLPLERRHVRMCIEKELLDRGRFLSNEDKNDILDSLRYWPDKKKGVYSTSGCKRIGKKIDLFLD